MKNYIKHDPWKIIEEGFHVEHNEITESLMSLGNGRMGQRGNFEEGYSGKSLLGNYIAGVWFPDKTRVGWWKNGYPDYFAKVINATNWIKIGVYVGDEQLDLANCKILDFRRELDMQSGTLARICTVEMADGKQLKIDTIRFCSLSHDHAAVISYAVTPLNFTGQLTFEPALDGDVRNRDANHDEIFWEEVSKETKSGEAYLTMRTKKSQWERVPTFTLCSGMSVKIFQNGKELDLASLPLKSEKFAGASYEINAFENEEIVIQKYVTNFSTLDANEDALKETTKNYLDKIYSIGFDELFRQQQNAWAEKWKMDDIRIEGDVSAQQGIRFNIFQLQQTYTGEDARFNIGPKGFTGEKYGGVTYWDTEAYCLPFYLATAPPKVARNLLIYRHNHLQKAIENAQKLGFSDGAALYPMVTMNGEECHNEWEITFEEIHRNGAIAHAIFDYINYTKDESYLSEFGLDVLIGISRFWTQRVNWSDNLEKYVMLGVTGPNEYENNVNNNWYTNYIAVWTLKYTIEAIEKVQNQNEARFDEICEKLNFDEIHEVGSWLHIIDNMHFPYDENRQVFLQQDGFLDKELKSADKISEHRPINQKWSWDRILRSCFIKQADVLQGLYLFESDFDEETHRRNFDFYEPMTVHESSLSPCVHTILAAKLGKTEKAYEMYVRTARLDLDDYNNDTEDGLHITSMAGTWMSVVKGFGGMRVKNGQVSFKPTLPDQWESYSFRVLANGNILQVNVSKDGTTFENFGEETVTVLLNDKKVEISPV